MTDEFPWTNEGTPSDAPTGSLESLGIIVPEESPGNSEVIIPSAEIAASSRRALREAERAAASTGRRGFRTVRAARPAAEQAPAASIAAAPTGASAPIDAAASVIPAAASARAGHGKRSALATRPAAGPVAIRHAAAPRPPLARRIAQKAFPPVVMVAAAALLIGTSVPANALYPDQTAAVALGSVTSAAVESGPAEPAQVLEMAADAEIAAPVATRDEFTVTSYAEMLRLKYGSRNFSYTTSGTGAVRWPFPVAVEISSGFGDRAAPCFGCSSYHQGLDFTPGAGAPIFSVADGVVSLHEEGGGFGNHVFIDHVVNGQRVTSVYAHMQYGSSPLQVGDTIKAGEFIGLVGSTGASTGAHLHLEIRIDGIAVDPFAWLTANAS